MRARVRSESAQRVSGCVTALLREQPFFGSLALRLPVRADCGCYSACRFDAGRRANLMSFLDSGGSNLRDE